MRRYSDTKSSTKLFTKPRFTALSTTRTKHAQFCHIKGTKGWTLALRFVNYPFGRTLYGAIGTCVFYLHLQKRSKKSCRILSQSPLGNFVCGCLQRNLPHTSLLTTNSSFSYGKNTEFSFVMRFDHYQKHTSGTTSQVESARIIHRQPLLLPLYPSPAFFS